MRIDAKRLRKQNHSWGAIAAALASQGVVQGADPKPITRRRLTALIAVTERRRRLRIELHEALCRKRTALTAKRASAETGTKRGRLYGGMSCTERTITVLNRAHAQMSVRRSIQVQGED